jgi:hypothetical protein
VLLSVNVKDTVGFLRVREGQDYTPIGACFFVNLTDGHHVFSYVVTNKHVVDGPVELGQDIYLRVNRRDVVEVEYVKLAAQWVYHTDYLIECASYLRNNGSPLFIAAQAPDGQPSLALLGILTASYRQRLLTTTDDDSVLSRLDSGISLVTPAECILEVLRQDELVDLRMKGAGAGRLSPSQPNVRDN